MARSSRRRLQARVDDQSDQSDQSDHCLNRDRFLFWLAPDPHATLKFAAEFCQHRNITVALPG